MAPTRYIAHARIPYQLDADRYCKYEDDGDGNDDAYVRMGDVVDVCEDVLGSDSNVHSVVRSGAIAAVEYDIDGFLCGVTLNELCEDGRERYVYLDGCFYHHKEGYDE